MKRFGLRVLKGCGMFALARSMSADMARILMYHNFSGATGTDSDEVSATAARTQLAYLRRHFHVIHLSRLVEQLSSGAPLQKHTAALTVDDGRRNFYELLFPLLREFQMPATFFVVSSFIRREDWVWTDKVLWLAEQPFRSEDLAPNRIDHFFQKLNCLRPEIRNERMSAVAEAMRVSIPNEPPPKYAPCSWSELREMADSGLVEIGSHTVTHPILASLTDEECWSELITSRAQIEQGLGRKVESFCFPNGKPSDYRPSQLSQIREAGYTSAVLSRFGLAGKESSVYELPRIGISGKMDLLSFAKYVDGAEYYQGRLRSLLRSRRPGKAGSV
ncbi:MAG: polysaccharide deacetylase family protein [Candidatus Sulfotelmatobacter sp.]